MIIPDVQHTQPNYIKVCKYISRRSCIFSEDNCINAGAVSTSTFGKRQTESVCRKLQPVEIDTGVNDMSIIKEWKSQLWTSLVFLGFRTSHHFRARKFSVGKSHSSNRINRFRHDDFRLLDRRVVQSSTLSEWTGFPHPDFVPLIK